MGNKSWTPAGTVTAQETKYYDERTLRRLTRVQVAAAWSRKYYDDRGEWPMIKTIMLTLDVGQGTAQRGRAAARGEQA